ncbi:CDK-activating kinase assembly factor MAT1 isoform 2 [Daubentonia madagascariensis]|uniref:CDK-activating kinase assembly factor MAT1 n=1 Tax=Daubentonia madagascariensis TaxID=31869 RepID=A0ABD2EUC2_DAUMA
MDDQGCPRCKTTKYRNPSLKLMVNVCGHTLCESCVDLLFVRGAGNCPECGTPLRKSNFRVQLFEDPTVDKEVEIRKKVLKIYNKREEDFPSLREYNDFLEEVEEIVFNLTNNVDLDNTKKKMEIYQKENKDVIQKNKLKLGQHISLAPIHKLEEALYEYQPLQIETCGPKVPEFEMLGRLGYLNHVRAASPQDLAGGYTSSLACHRALQDAFSGLFWQPS